MVFLWIIVAIVMFSLIVMIHEFWHFKSARIFWVKVYEFWLGIPPKAKVLFTDKLWTIYTLNWLPIGWFVRMKWENVNYFMIFDENKIQYKQEELEQILKSDKMIYDKDFDEISLSNRKEIFKQLSENKDKDNLINKPYWQQSIVILAWVFMNFVLAIFIFTVLFIVWVKPVWINDSIETNLDIKIFPTFRQAVNEWLLKVNPWIVMTPLTWSLAEKSNIKSWDLLFQIYTCSSKMLDYTSCEWWEKNIVHNIDKPEDVIKIVKENAWKTVAFYLNAWILSGDKEKEFWEKWYVWWSFVKIEIPVDWKIGSFLSPNIEYNKDFEYKYSIVDSFLIWTKETYNQSLLTLKALGIFVRKLIIPTSKEERTEALNSVSWPVWILWVVTDSLKWWITLLFILWGIISISLWVFNLLPLPALDWWRFAFMTINEVIRKITWKKLISPHIEWVIHLSFFVILIILSIIVTYNDVLKIVEK